MTRFSLPDWHSQHIPNWIKWLESYKGKAVNAIEVGSCEGRSALWLLKNILYHHNSLLECIDPFSDSGFDGSDISHTGVKANQTYLNFQENTKEYTEFNFDKPNLVLNRGNSAIVLRDLVDDYYDIIYIDGSHLAVDVLNDIVLSWPLLRRGGVLILDDYEWKSTTGKVQDEPRMAIDMFLAIFHGLYEVLGIGIQVAVRKK